MGQKSPEVEVGMSTTAATVPEHVSEVLRILHPHRPRTSTRRILLGPLGEVFDGVPVCLITHLRSSSNIAGEGSHFSSVND